MSKLKSFKAFSEERVNQIVITFGRFQPPTIGHEKLLKKVVSLAQSNNYRIYTSQTHDSKKNPLDYSTKVKYLRKMFPKYGRNIIEDSGIRSIFDALVNLHNQKYSKVILVVGADRTEEFKRLLLKYNGVEARHGFYDFKDGIEIISSGDRDPDADDVSGMSSSKMRAAAKENNFDDFKKGLPRSFTGSLELFNELRKSMGLKESCGSRIHVKLKTISNKREDFIKGNILNIGEHVRIIESGEEGIIEEHGPNFVIVKTRQGETVRKWLSAVEKLNK